MNQLELINKLENIKGHGTSMITMTLATNPNALANALDTLKREYSVSANIKSRL